MNRMSTLWALLLWACLLMPFYGSTFAGTLKIETRATVTVQGDLLQGTVEVLNRGTDPANAMNAEVIVLGEHLQMSLKDRMDVNGSETFSFRKSIEGWRPGRYPLTIIVRFHDVNQYPFSALTCTTFDYREVTPPLNLYFQSNDLDMERKGDVVFRVKNHESHGQVFKARLVLPDELSTPEHEEEFQLLPGKGKRVTFRVLNRGARLGAIYPVFGILEYDRDERHTCMVTRAMVRIVNTENWFRKTRWYWLFGAVVITLIFMGSQWSRENHNDFKTC